jgi:hypothetical protein
MRLSDQAVGTLMMTLQKCLLEQSDIVPVLKEYDFVVQGESQDELVITNPPTVSFDNEFLDDLEEVRES